MTETLPTIQVKANGKKKIIHPKKNTRTTMPKWITNNLDQANNLSFTVLPEPPPRKGPKEVLQTYQIYPDGTKKILSPADKDFSPPVKSGTVSPKAPSLRMYPPLQPTKQSAPSVAKGTKSKPSQTWLLSPLRHGRIFSDPFPMHERARKRRQGGGSLPGWAEPGASQPRTGKARRERKMAMSELKSSVGEQMKILCEGGDSSKTSAKVDPATARVEGIVIRDRARILSPEPGPSMASAEDAAAAARADKIARREKAKRLAAEFALSEKSTSRPDSGSPGPRLVKESRRAASVAEPQPKYPPPGVDVRDFALPPAKKSSSTAPKTSTPGSESGFLDPRAPSVAAPQQRKETAPPLAAKKPAPPVVKRKPVPAAAVKQPAPPVVVKQPVPAAAAKQPAPAAKVKKPAPAAKVKGPAIGPVLPRSGRPSHLPPKMMMPDPPRPKKSAPQQQAPTINVYVPHDGFVRVQERIKGVKGEKEDGGLCCGCTLM